MFDGITPKYERALGVTILVEPRCSNAFREWSRERPLLIGTAFDYALRFEVQRINPRARAGDWVAEGACKQLIAQASSRRAAAKREAACHARLAESVVRAARACHRSYMRRGTRGQSLRRELAGHAIRLAKLDDYYRKGLFDTSLTEVEDEDVEEICRLLDVAPLDRFKGRRPPMLNPIFGSRAIGADGDMIIDGRLIDIKTARNPYVERHMVRQLIGYLLLAEQKSLHRTFGRLKTLEIYFARFGHFWSMPVDDVQARPAYRLIMRWFTERYC
jgi:hypothetical protein